MQPNVVDISICLGPHFSSTLGNAETPPIVVQLHQGTGCIREKSTSTSWQQKLNSTLIGWPYCIIYIIYIYTLYYVSKTSTQVEASHPPYLRTSQKTPLVPHDILSKNRQPFNQESARLLLQICLGLNFLFDFCKGKQQKKTLQKKITS